jgi:hypothetical protein
MASSISCKPWPKLLYLHWVAIKLRLGPNPSVRACAGQEAGCRPVEEGQGFPAGYLGQVKHARTSSYARTRNWFRKKKRYSIGSHGGRADARQVAAAGEAMQSEASSPAGAVQVRSESDAAVHVRGQTCMVDARTTGRQVAAAGRVTPPPLPAGA